MHINSAKTYARAFTANTQLHEAAGNYENKLATKIAKGIVGALTLGIGYGIIRLIENYCNVRDKINDYCANAENIHNGIAVAIVTGNNVAEIKLQDNRILTLEQINHEHVSESSVRISDGEHTEEIPGTFSDICMKLGQEFNNAPGLYNISSQYQPLDFFLQMRACTIAPVINFSPVTGQYENLYENNILNIHNALSKAISMEMTGAKVTLIGGSEIEFSISQESGDEQKKSQITNGLQVMEVEGTFTDLCREYELLLYTKDQNIDFTTLDERLAEVKANKNSAGAIPDLEDFTLTASCMADAETARLAEATQRFNAAYGDSAPPSRPPLRFK
ncbi:hypothetical protein HBY09_000409 [Salmonella enterica]|nr:hypothetical protein [Salmonella enterica]